MKKSNTPAQSGGAFKAESYVGPNCTLEQVQEIKQAFDLFDTDQGGSVDTKGINISKLRIESCHDFSRF